MAGRIGRILVAIAIVVLAPSVPVAASPVSLDSLAWRNIGPFRGGRATAIAGVTSKPYTFYLGTAGGGIYETTDAGMHWKNISDGFLKTASVGAIAVAPSNAEIIYAGMGEDTARANTLHSGDGIYKSADGGKTWTHLGPEATESISRIVVDPKDPDKVYLAAQGALYAPSEARGVYRSTDGGKTWTKVLFVSDTAGAADLSMDPRDPDTLYAALWDYQRHPWALRQFGPAAGIYKSVNGGDSWTKIDNGLPDQIGKIAVAVSAKPDRIYAVMQADPNSQSGFYRSEDGGKDWKLINADARLTTRAFYFTKVFADPKDPNTVWVADLSLYRTTDGGKSFTPIATPHGDHHELWINSGNTQILAEASDGGGSVSLDNGDTWSGVDNQPTGQFYRLSADNGFPYRIYAAQQDNTTIAILSRSEWPGIGEKDWYPVGGTESSFLDIDPNHPDLVYASDTMGIFDVFSQSKRTEQKRPIHAAFAWGTLYDEFTKYRYSLNAPVFVSRHDPRKIYYGAQKLLLTADRGKSWREVSPDLTRAGIDPSWNQHTHDGLIGDSNYDVLTYATESPLVAGELWTGSSDGVVGVSRNGGKRWSTTILPAPASDARVNCIDPSPFDPAVAYVAATRFQYDDRTPYLFKTKDYGKTWVRIDASLPPGAYARAIRSDTVRKGLLFAGTETGVYVSFNDGSFWQPLQGHLPVTPITDLKVHDNDLIASTSGRGIWILDDIAPLRGMPADLDRADAYLFPPSLAYRSAFGAGVDHDEHADQGENPPHGAIIDIFLQRKTPLTLEILDSKGNLVRRLSSSDAKAIKDEAGLQRVVWDMRYGPIAPMPPEIHIDGLVPQPKAPLANPGIYTVRVTAGGRSLSAPLKLGADPRWKNTPKEYAEQDRLLGAIDSDLSSVRSTAIKIYSAHRQVASLMDRTRDPETIAAGKALLDKLSVDRAQLLYSHLAYLANWVNTPEPDVVASERQMYVELHAKTRSWLTDANGVLGTELAAFNAQLMKAGMPAVVPETELKAPPSKAAAAKNASADGDDFD